MGTKVIDATRATAALIAAALLISRSDTISAQTSSAKEDARSVVDISIESTPSNGPKLLSYPTSPKLTVAPLSEDKLSILHQLIEPRIPNQALTLRDASLCPPSVTKVEPVDDSAQKGLATLETRINPELHFIREGESKGLELEHFAIGIEFKQTRVNLKHSSPRFPSEAGGFSVQMVGNSSRAIRLEGRLGADIFALIPPLADCNVQGVVLCPRRYTKEGVLVPAPYRVDRILPITTAKADGVYAPPSGIEGQLVVSLLATPGLLLPREWRRDARGFESISQSVKVVEGGARSAIGDGKIDSLPGWINVARFPYTIGLAARADFGRPGGAVRSTSKTRVTELSMVTIADLDSVMLGTSELEVKGGECVMVAQWAIEGVG
jgi:hypothetical protein